MGEVWLKTKQPSAIGYSYKLECAYKSIVETLFLLLYCSNLYILGCLQITVILPVNEKTLVPIVVGISQLKYTSSWQLNISLWRLFSLRYLYNIHTVVILPIWIANVSVNLGDIPCTVLEMSELEGDFWSMMMVATTENFN